MIIINILNISMTITLVSFGAGRSPIYPASSARRSVAGTPRRSAIPTSVSAPAGLTPESLYVPCTSVLFSKCMCVNSFSLPEGEPPGASEIYGFATNSIDESMTRRRLAP